jgi:hypothetical protein
MLVKSLEKWVFGKKNGGISSSSRVKGENGAMPVAERLNGVATSPQKSTKWTVETTL